MKMKGNKMDGMENMTSHIWMVN